MKIGRRGKYSMQGDDDTNRQRLPARSRRASIRATKPHQKSQSGIPSKYIVDHLERHLDTTTWGSLLGLLVHHSRRDIHRLGIFVYQVLKYFCLPPCTFTRLSQTQYVMFKWLMLIYLQISWFWSKERGLLLQFPYFGCGPDCSRTIACRISWFRFGLVHAVSFYIVQICFFSNQNVKDEIIWYFVETSCWLKTGSNEKPVLQLSVQHLVHTADKPIYCRLQYHCSKIRTKLYILLKHIYNIFSSQNGSNANFR